MPADAYLRTVSIGRCRVVVGIPLDLAAFRADLERPDADFVHCHPIWALYRREVIEPAAHVLETARRVGAGVITGATLDDFEAMFTEPLDVIFLITHWCGETIEFRDGLHPVQSVIERIPPRFDGAIDLCVCHPESLAIAIRDRFPEVVTHYPRIPAKPRAFFPYVRAMLWRLSHGDCSYLTASSEIVGAFLAPARRRIAA